MHSELTERHSHLPLAYLFLIMHSGFIQILSNFTCVTESVLAYSYLAENLEEWEWKGSRRGRESDSQSRSAATIPCKRNPWERASCCWGISSSQHNCQSLVMVSKARKDCHGTTALRWASDSSHHGGRRWRGRGSWGEKLSRHPGR